MTKMKIQNLTLIIALLSLFACQNQVQMTPQEKLISELDEQFTHFLSITPEGKEVPRSYPENNQIRMASPKDWTCGFPPGSMWYMYELTGDEKWKEAATKNTLKFEEVKNRTNTHDLGFMIYCSYGNAYRLTNIEAYKDVIIETSETLITRFNPTVGCIRSWDFGEWQYPVIIDNMMNLEMLFWASKVTGNSKYKEVAISHADVTMENHFREDMSSFHVVSYDTITGKPLEKQTHQGYSDDSAWSRGQAWGLYGYTMCYRETKDEKYLDVAQKIADFIIKNAPEDMIPFWDYNAPEIPNEPKDASAAAITASALFELSGYSAENKESYLNAANKIIESLNSEKYRAKIGTNKGFLLEHSTGHKPKESEVDVAINYADYYYLEALLRQKNINTK